jgi:hypothetical protein
VLKKGRSIKSDLFSKARFQTFLIMCNHGPDQPV